MLPSNAQALANGAIAVDVFILLSGFVITMLVLDKREPYLLFLFRRYFRLFPVFAICICAALLAQLMGWMPIRYSMGDLLPLIAANIALFHGIIPETAIPNAAGAILNPSWSISLEWQFYLIAPALILCMSRRYYGFLLGSLACFTLYRIMVPSLSDFTGAFLPFKIHLFWFGIASALALRFATPVIGSGENWPFGAAIGLLAALCLLLPAKQALGLAIWVGAIMVIMKPNAPISIILRNKILLALGAVSYPLYLSHEVVIWIVVYYLREFGLNNPLELAIIVTLTAVPISFAVSWLIHWLVEDPFNFWAKRYSFGKRSDSVAAKT